MRFKPEAAASPAAPQPPHLPARLQPATAWRLSNGETYQGLAVSRGTVSDAAARDVKLDGMRLSGAGLARTQLPEVEVVDTLFSACDLANAEWRAARIRRTEFAECRLVGARLNEARAQDVLFRRCDLRLAQFRFARFKAARFVDCVLADADFQEADLTGVVFSGCDLAGADLSGARLAGADIRGSRAPGLRVRAADVEGLIVEPSQAIDLVYLLGMTVLPPARE